MSLSDGFPRVGVPCKHCDLSPTELLRNVVPGQVRTYGAADYYVTPDGHHWPRYDASANKFVYLEESSADSNYSNMPSMLDLSEEEHESLEVIHIFVNYKVVVGGKAICANKRKTSVVRAEWHQSPMPPSTRFKLLSTGYVSTIKLLSATAASILGGGGTEGVTH